MSTESTSKAIPAATVIIGRNRRDSFEIFMVVRHQQIDFASGALVFPGGKVSTSDTEPGIRQHCSNTDGLEESELGSRVAAIRETFEESGILLARPRGREEIIPGELLPPLEVYRDQLNQNETTLLDFLRRERLVLALDRLVPFAHWITPDVMPKRFDTTFYLVEAPENHLGKHDGKESVDSTWITPEDALEAYTKKERTLIFPTRMNIQKLNRYRSIDEAIRVARDSRVVTVCPWIEERPSGAVLCIPEEADYNLTEESLEKIMEDA